MQLGSVSTLGFIIARHLYQEGVKAVNTEGIVLEDMEIEESEDATVKCTDVELLSNSVEKIGLYISFGKQIYLLLLQYFLLN